VTMPMMSIEAVKQADRLIQERGRIAVAKWDHVVEIPANGLASFLDCVPADEQLRSAIEEFRKRKLDAIDSQLRELGVDPTERDSTA